VRFFFVVFLLFLLESATPRDFKPKHFLFDLCFHLIFSFSDQKHSLLERHLLSSANQQTSKETHIKLQQINKALTKPVTTLFQSSRLKLRYIDRITRANDAFEKTLISVPRQFA